jgi:glycosyltransferase involved in cell wall biosynthesis
VPAERRRALVTVSGAVPHDLDAQIEAGRRPRADYLEIAHALELVGLDADIVDVTVAAAATGRLGRLLYRIAGAGGLLGWYCFRRRYRYEAILTDGEQVGIPLALLSRLLGPLVGHGSARHTMIVHILSVPKKARMIGWFRLAGLIDQYVVYSSRQREFIHHRFGVPLDRIALSTFMVDTRFFDPGAVDAAPRRMVCTAGLERRDYDTFIEAVDGLDVDVVIAAASPWSKQADSTRDRSLPPNVEIRRLDLFELRELYAAAEFVVMPLHEVDFQAGITTILEAMSMGLAVVCTRTAGQTDTIVDGETGRYVPVGDANALHDAVESLLDDPDGARRLGVAARAWVVEHADIERYATGLAEVVADQIVM